ncbi:uncharacterized protein MYCFIDRAFT_212090, partial [Pseudocercospora fijiensis CIRAD86]
ATTHPYLLEPSPDLSFRLAIPLTCTSASYCGIAKLVTPAFERRRESRSVTTARRRHTTYVYHSFGYKHQSWQRSPDQRCHADDDTTLSNTKYAAPKRLLNLETAPRWASSTR